MPEPAPQPTEPGDWSDYYRHTEGRDVRPLFANGMAAAAEANVRPGHAVDLGFGDGTESVALLQAGWRVTAIDSTPSAAGILHEKVPEGLAGRLEIITGDAEDIALPEFDLLYAGYSLSYIHPDRFPVVWARIRERMRPGAFLVVNVFGVRDTWAGDADMTFIDRPAAEALVAGLDVRAIAEEDADGPSGSGPKHWHVFDLIAQRPRRAER